MGPAEVEAFLTHLAVEAKVGADVRTTMLYTHVTAKGAMG